MRARNNVSYLTVRRFSAQDRVNAIRAIKRLKADAGEHEIGLAAAEIALLWLRVSGNPGGWTITNIAAEHSGGNSFGSRLAVAVADRLSLGYPASLTRPADQGRLPSEGIPPPANGGQADRRDARNR